MKAESSESVHLKRIRLNKERNIAKDPCYAEHEISLNCLDEHAFEREKCALQIENFKRCRKFWYDIVQDRTKRGIRPYEPKPEDRAAIKQEYIDSLKNQSRQRR